MKPSKPNSEIETMVGVDNTTTTVSCKEGGEVSISHSNGQAGQLAQEVEELKNKMVQDIGDLKVEIGDLKEEIGDLKELMEKHMEGKEKKLFPASTTNTNAASSTNTNITAMIDYVQAYY